VAGPDSARHGIAVGDHIAYKLGRYEPVILSVDGVEPERMHNVMHAEEVEAVLDK